MITVKSLQWEQNPEGQATVKLSVNGGHLHAGSYFFSDFTYLMFLTGLPSECLGMCWLLFPYLSPTDSCLFSFKLMFWALVSQTVFWVFGALRVLELGWGAWVSREGALINRPPLAPGCSLWFLDHWAWGGSSASPHLHEQSHSLLPVLLPRWIEFLDNELLNCFC